MKLGTRADGTTSLVPVASLLGIAAANRPQQPRQAIMVRNVAQAAERAETLARPFVGQRKTAPGKDAGLFRR